MWSHPRDAHRTKGVADGGPRGKAATDDERRVVRATTVPFSSTSVPGVARTSKCWSRPEVGVHSCADTTAAHGPDSSAVRALGTAPECEAGGPERPCRVNASVFSYVVVMGEESRTWTGKERPSHSAELERFHLQRRNGAY